MYDEILKLFIEKYKNIDIQFTNKKFNSLKEKLPKEDYKALKDIDIIDNVKFLDNIMLKIHLKFLIENTYSEIRIFGTNDSLNNLNKKEIIQYLIDGMYKVYVVIMSDEKEETYIKLYNELKINYNFISNFLICDFSMSNINEIIEYIKMIT